MFFIISKLLYFLVSPLIWITALLLGGLLSKNINKKQSLFISAFVLLLFFTNPFIANMIMRWWEIPARTMEDITQPYPAGVMLGGTFRNYNTDYIRPVYGSGVDRFIQSIVLYQNKKIKKILLSGGSGSLVFTDIKEAKILKDVLMQMRIDTSDVIIENESKNTYENAVFTARVLKANNITGKVLLITSAFHMRRSLKCFAKAGVSVDAFSVDTRSGKNTYTPDKILIPDAERLIDWEMLMHEWAGCVMYKMAGYI